MGVFKWLRRERVTVTTGHISPPSPIPDDPPSQVGTIRTEEYKRDLAEFQARRSSSNKDLQETPVKSKKCGRHSLPVSCTDCTGDPDKTFNYEKKSAIKYKKKSQSHKRTQSDNSEEKGGVPNVQFLFQNQIFMPGNMFATSSYSEPRRSSKHLSRQRSPDFPVQKQIDFKDDQPPSPPFLFKNNSLPFNTKEFLEGVGNDKEEVDGVSAAGDVKTSSRSSGSSNKNDSCDEKLWEVMSELKHFDQWADEQLQVPSVNTSKSDDSKSDTSAFGLPIASACNLNVNMEKSKTWSHGKWGVVPVQLKQLAGVSVERVRKKQSMEINILRKCRHPNIILLMGLYPDAQNNINIICERCTDSLFGILHVQGRILSAQTSVHYALDIANALVFLRMQGFVHTEFSSMSVMVTAQDTAKLADVGPCVKLQAKKNVQKKGYDVYSPEPQYVNLTDTRNCALESQPLISQRSSEAYLQDNAVPKHYKAYSESEHYRWQAPELFEPDEDGLVYPCSKSDVYSLCMMLWECCNATLPWKSYSYKKLKELYIQWQIGIQLPQDGTYPGSLLSLLQQGLELQREGRIDLASLQSTLQAVQLNLDEIEYIIIPARLSKKKSSFSTQAWDTTTTSPTDSDCISPKNIEHRAQIHKRASTNSTDSTDKDTKSPFYETIRKADRITSYTTEKCFISDEENIPIHKCGYIQDLSSACSTPVAKLRARMKDIESPGTLHRSDSTEYCSILSPDARNFALNDDSNKDQSVERSTAKLSRSFTPKSYKPLHIKVPEFNLDSVKDILKEQNGCERSSYNFDIKNYSLPTTPIARSNKLRKNAWLSGDLNVNKFNFNKHKSKNETVTTATEETEIQKSVTPVVSNKIFEKESKSDRLPSTELGRKETVSCESINTIGTLRDSFTGLRRITDPPPDFSPDTIGPPLLERARSLNCIKNIGDTKYSKIEEDILANVNVKPLVAIHEKWIYEANKKTGRSMSCPEDNRSNVTAVKPASHCVDTFQKSLPQLNVRKSSVGKTFRLQPTPNVGKNGSHYEQYCLAREAISKSTSLRSMDNNNTLIKALEKSTLTDDIKDKEPMVDRSTDTLSIEEFIRDLIRKEFQHLIGEISASDTASESTNGAQKGDDLLNKGVANIISSLKSNEDEIKKDPIKSFSRIKINGNNKPLLQITFSRTGENTLQVLDNCVNVTLSDSNGGSGRDKLNLSMDETLTGEEIHINTLKRCQAFNAIQEARSTEDLYIDDDLSTHMQENFGGKVKLIPLHGSLHEILCEREDDCCLLKVKQENGCDSIYFRCDNSETDSRDAIDGNERSKDTVVYKRSISLIEERIQRIFPKEKRPNPSALKKFNDKLKARPKSEMFIKNISKESRVLSNSSPSLSMDGGRNEEVELNIENVMCYQDSSSDECLKCPMDSDEFETLEREIEEDIANNLTPLNTGCLEKISEENLSVINEDLTDEN